MFITKKHLPRRHVLRGVGAAISLPMLDAMTPAATAQAPTNLRVGFIYVPHGAVETSWTPNTTGTDFELPPILQPLKDLQQYLTVVSGLRNKPAESADPHAIKAGCWLRCVAPEGTSSPEDGISADQYIARSFSGKTPFASLEVTTAEGGSGSFASTIAFKTPSQPLPMESNPRKLYYRLFGQGDTTAERMAISTETVSLLDYVLEDARSLNLKLGSSDRVMMSEYLDSIRDIELQLAKLAEQDLSSLDIPEAPLGTPNNFPLHLDLMYSLMALAYQADLTRVMTFMSDREVSMRTFTHIGVADAFHPLSHHQNDQAKMERLARVQTWYMSAFAKFAQKLSSIPEGGSNILDNSLLMYGSGMANSNLHNCSPVPALLLGKAEGKLKGNQHFAYPENTPLANLMLTVLQKADVQIERFGDSTDILTEV
jgi:hypothetical protein